MSIRDFIGIIRELSFSEIRHEAMIPPRILVIASSIENGREWSHSLFGDDANTVSEIVDPTDARVDPLAYDVIVSIGSLNEARAIEWTELHRRADSEMLLVQVPHDARRDQAGLEEIRRRLCDVARDRSVAFGRYINSMRPSATDEIISDTSRVNAQFAALSNIPALIPVVGTMFAAGADFVVLTKNQLMMMYRLAAIYDRDLDDRWRVYAELAPVVGAGLVWRTAARQIAAVLPVLLGAIPKVTIAYAGTFAVGHAARYYFENGDRMNAEELEHFYRAAVERLGMNRTEVEDDPLPRNEMAKTGPGS